MDGHETDSNDSQEELSHGNDSGDDGGPGGFSNDGFSDNGGNINPDNNESDEEDFDISLAATHSYMGPGLVAVSGRSVLEAGWCGRVPAVGHHGCVFPGETVPMLLTDAQDVTVITAAIEQDKLFGLLCPDERCTTLSGYGVLCEVFEASLEDEPGRLSFKARATHRFRFKDMPKNPLPIQTYSRMRAVEVVVLPEVLLREPLRHARLASLDAHRRARTALDARLRGMDAALTPWPLFVYDIFDYGRMRELLRNYFRSMMMDKLPEEPVSLSFWVASNLALSLRDRIALFVVDDALLRLHMELRLISRKSILCCSSCMVEIALREHVFAMSSEGVHSNYTNLSGYMHDVVTVSRATNAVLHGAASAEFSWFPGYAWTVMLCRGCMSHIGWRFDALRRGLRPSRFFGLCRNSVQPRHVNAPSARSDDL